MDEKSKVNEDEAGRETRPVMQKVCKKARVVSVFSFSVANPSLPSHVAAKCKNFYRLINGNDYEYKGKSSIDPCSSSCKKLKTELRDKGVLTI